MRLFPWFLLATSLTVACSDPPCRPTEFKVGNNCYPKNKKPDGGPDESVADESAESEEGRTHRDAQVGLDAQPALPVDAEVDASADAQPPASEDGSSAADAGPACAPRPEICDGQDNDCDQKVDEEVSESPLGSECPSGGEGACAAPGTYTCFNGEIICNAAATPTPEVCDGVDNDCKNGADDGLKNACGGDLCSADLARLGQKCSAGEGDCAGDGVYECDPTKANNDVRCTAVAKQKNACGTSCGPVPVEVCDGVDNNCDGLTDEGLKNACGTCGPLAEKCNTVQDDDCDGQINEGCCGDGDLSPLEECDPTAAPWTPWTCSQLCQRNTLYSPCLSDADCAGAVGNRKVECLTQYAICSITCKEGSTLPETSCPPSPGNGSAGCFNIGGLGGRCFISSCTLPSNTGCAAGSSCVGSGNPPNAITVCLGCDTHAACPTNQHCEFQNGFGMCKLGPP